MRNAFLALVTLLSLSACTTAPEMAHDAAKKIVYFKDDRSGLCFALWQYGESATQGALANVPCEKVENMLVNK